MNVLSSVIKLLTFRITREDILPFNKSHLITGLIGTWMVGIGRYWDDPGAKLLQHLGLGSVIYIFCLSAFIWLIILPFRVKKWNYFTILTFVSLTSFPAILYAIPVERFFDTNTAAKLNVWFLIIVASWRLTMLFIFIGRFCQFEAYIVFSVALLPICLIVNILSLLNLERAVFQIMGGIRNQAANDDAYATLLVITVVSYIFIIPILTGYILGIIGYRKKSKS